MTPADQVYKNSSPHVLSIHAQEQPAECIKNWRTVESIDDNADSPWRQVWPYVQDVINHCYQYVTDPCKCTDAAERSLFTTASCFTRSLNPAIYLHTETGKR